jgi:hypothetical protein
MGGTAASSQAQFCGDCGRPLSTKFCTQCGASTPPSNATSNPESGRGSGGNAFLDTLIGEEKESIPRTALRFALAPVTTILELADDPAYKSQWRFMAACTTVFITLAFTVLPRLTHVQVPDAKAWHLLSQGAQYVAYFLNTPLQYYMFRWISGSRQRTLKNYFKLCALSVGYTTLLAMAGMIAIGLILAALQAANVRISFGPAKAIETLLRLGPAVVFVILSHKAYWKVGVARATVMAFVALCASILLGEGLKFAVERLDLPRQLSMWLP